MKTSETLIARVHAGLLEVLAAEEPAAGRESDDTLSLARRLVDIAFLEIAGKAFIGGYDAELDHRARLLVAVSGIAVKGTAQRVGRAVRCYHRALTAALGATEGAVE